MKQSTSKVEWLGRRAAVRSLVGLFLIAGCAITVSEGTVLATGAASKPNTNGTISIGVLYSPTSLNPATSTAGLDTLYLSMVYDTLIQQNPKNGDLEPMLATSWKVTGVSRLAWDVFLRKGVKFQDGTPFNAQAVVDFSKAYIAAGDVGNALQYVTSVSAVGKYEVVYHLSQQNSQLPFGLASHGGMIPSPTALAKEGSSFATNPVGAGPYSFKSEVAGSSYSFTRFNGYWNNAKQPREQNITFQVFSSDTALVTAIQSATSTSPRVFRRPTWPR